jgi:hypothetical protein
MQPRWRPRGTYGCIRRYRPARTGGTHEIVPQPRVVDRVACRGPGRLGHGHRARGRDRPSPCPAAARRHRLRPAAAHTQALPGTVADAHGLTHRNTNPRPVTDALLTAEPGTVTDAHGLAQPGTVTDTQALALRRTVAHPVPNAGTITVTGTHQPPIGAQQRSEPRGVH